MPNDIVRRRATRLPRGLAFARLKKLTIRAAWQPRKGKRVGLTRGLTAVEHRVLDCLAQHAHTDPDGLCWPSLNTIAEYSGQQRRDRLGAPLRRLEKLRFYETIQRGGGRRNPTLRRVLFHDLQPLDSETRDDVLKWWRIRRRDGASFRNRETGSVTAAKGAA